MEKDMSAAPVGAVMTEEELRQFEQFKRAKLIEQTKARIAKMERDCLEPALSSTELKNICRTANNSGLGGVVVYPAFVRECVGYLGPDPVCSLIAAVSFPHGADSTSGKVAAVRRAVKDGVDGVEVCAPIFAVRQDNMSYVRREFKKLVKACRPRALRIVVDCSSLSEKDVLRVAVCAAECRVHALRLVRPSGPSQIVSVRSAINDAPVIKAEGCSLADMEELEASGASLVGCPSALDVASRLLAAVRNM